VSKQCKHITQLPRKYIWVLPLVSWLLFIYEQLAPWFFLRYRRYINHLLTYLLTYLSLSHVANVTNIQKQILQVYKKIYQTKEKKTNKKILAINFFYIYFNVNSYKTNAGGVHTLAILTMSVRLCVTSLLAAAAVFSIILTVSPTSKWLTYNRPAPYNTVQLLHL